ncbi:VOC family protein [Sphaerisporangium sp. TRM90804]|uniref:VOC family protein n=1 Tax=Sphaerisporangium sp. TRM90804 TaxID=3031113 RepID=UPI00244C0F21|nr:VOC family protein [Sphaerisporangium sp. TRM90804]MDH2424418.1 VOC family protein [Sphaerisporangium sp. TRM90804]
MSDPFEALWDPAMPLDPDPRFAARLRARVERALLDDVRGQTMRTQTRLRHGDVGYVTLQVPDAGRAASFYQEVLGWRYTPGASPQGREVAGVVPSHGIWGGQETRTLWACYQVDDVHDAVRRVREAGGRAEEPARRPYGLISTCADDQGLGFGVYEDAGEGLAPDGAEPGELAYLTVEVPDAARARAFYGEVFGWEFRPGNVEDGWQVHVGGAELRPMTGLLGGRERAAVVPMYAVADTHEAVARVRSLGGTSTEPERMPYGVTAECTDDQGIRFYVGDLA